MSEQPFYVIALGASAGGHQALWKFFAHLSPLPNVAFVVIQHLKADALSVADQLLAKYTTLHVGWAQDQQRLQANHVYLLPPGKYMTLAGRKLQITNRSPLNKINRAIDIFFTSLADQQDGHGIGIILSGAGSDGTQGAICMHQRGGKVLVQDPATADFPGMPLSAILNDHIALICSPEELARSVADLVTASEKPS